MDDARFTQGILDLRETLYRVSYGLLRQEHDRRDAVQETLSKAWEKRRQLRDGRQLSTWVIRILINECYNILRTQQRVLPVEDVPEPRQAPPDADPDLHAALLALPDALRLPIMLHYMEGYALKEIAAMLDIPVGTVGTRLHRARFLLKERLYDWEEVTSDA